MVPACTSNEAEMGTEDGRVTGNLTIEGRARAGRVWIAAWSSGNGRRRRKLLGPAWVKDSGRKTARGAVVWRAKDDLSNARVEAINTQIRMLTRRAFGFHSPESLIALAMLSLNGLCPPLPR